MPGTAPASPWSAPPSGAHLLVIRLLVVQVTRARNSDARKLPFTSDC
jgi:hypothetical protein